MNKQTQALLVALFGGILIGITITGRYTSYVKPGFGPLLLLAGAVLVLVGLATGIVGLRSSGRARDPERHDALDQVSDDHGAHDHGAHDHSAHDHSAHDHSGHDHDRSRAPWLVLAPILVLLVVAPQALGADAVTRNAGSQAIAGLAGVAPASGIGAAQGAGGTSGGYAFNDGSGHGEGTAAFAKKRPTLQFPALPPGDHPAVGIKDFVLRALYDGANSVSDNAVTVMGFIAPAGDGFTSGYSVARLVINCCAADASPMRIHVDEAPPGPVDTWVSVVAQARPGTASADNEYVPTADIRSMAAAGQPSDPYDH